MFLRRRSNLRASEACHNRTDIMSTKLGFLLELVNQGEKFTYANFASKSQRGYPNAFSADWIVWTHHAEEVADQFRQGSSVSKAIRNGLGGNLIGNDEDEYAQAHGAILNGLRAAARLMGEERTAESVPASDRVVSLNHNAPGYREAVTKLEEIITAVEQANDYPETSEHKEKLIAELSAGRRLLQASTAKVSAVVAVLRPALAWCAEKFASGIVGKSAEVAWNLLKTVLGL